MGTIPSPRPIHRMESLTSTRLSSVADDDRSGIDAEVMVLSRLVRPIAASDSTPPRPMDSPGDWVRPPWRVRCVTISANRACAVSLTASGVATAAGRSRQTYRAYPPKAATGDHSGRIAGSAGASPSNSSAP